MVKENLVLVEPTNIVAIFEYGDFVVEVVNDNKIREVTFWVRHKQYGVKIAFGGLDDACYCSCEICIDYLREILYGTIDDMICDYIEIVGVEFDEVLCEECANESGGI